MARGTSSCSTLWAALPCACAHGLFLLARVVGRWRCCSTREFLRFVVSVASPSPVNFCARATRSWLPRTARKCTATLPSGAPPMSVPHFDTRVVGGQAALLFGPYAGFTPKFLKNSTWCDLPFSVRFHNIGTMLQVGVRNIPLVKYLWGEVFASRSAQIAALREFMPAAQSQDWELISAGQRVQVMKHDPDRGGVLQFGTEVITGGQGTIAGLLGASPGASAAGPVMLGALARCFPDRMENWSSVLRSMIPSYGTRLSDDPGVAAASLARTAKVLGISG